MATEVDARYLYEDRRKGRDGENAATLQMPVEVAVRRFQLASNAKEQATLRLSTMII